MENRIDYGTLDLQHIFGHLEAPDLSGRERSKTAKLDGNDAPDISLAYLGPQIWPNNTESDDFKFEQINLDDLLDETLLNEGLGEITGIIRDEGIKESKEFVKSPEGSPQAASPVSCIQDVTGNEFGTDDFELVSQPTLNSLQSAKKQDEVGQQDISSYEPNITDMMISTPLDESTPTNQLFDPRKRTFTDEELKPQPIIRKAKKVYVPMESKDARYWHKREKNNAAAKRSREARRIKENQIVMRTKFLENENDNLRVEVKDLRAEVSRLMKVVERYQERERN